MLFDLVYILSKMAKNFEFFVKLAINEISIFDQNLLFLEKF